MEKSEIILKRIEKEVKDDFGAKHFFEDENTQIYLYLKSKLIGQDKFKIGDKTYIIEFKQSDVLESIYVEEITKINKYSVIRYLKELRNTKSKNPKIMQEIILYWENKLNELLLKEK